MGPDPFLSPLTWPAPAKLNLFLHVIGRREDGYHLLQTVFQFIELSDTLRLSPRTDGAVRHLSAPQGVPAEHDLVLRAVRRLKEFVDRPELGVDIELVKRIPLGAGLGGGSSDAATVLVALNQIWGLGLDEAQLSALGLGLGADVPVFVGGRAAWGEGIGEALTPVLLEEPWYVVVDPACHVSTAAIFSAPELTRNTPPTTIQRLTVGEEGALPVAALMSATANDLEPVARSRFPSVDEALRWLDRHGHARMTGSGGCIFAPMASEADAREVASMVPGPWLSFVVRGQNRSPLLDRAPSDHGPSLSPGARG